MNLQGFFPPSVIYVPKAPLLICFKSWMPACAGMTKGAAFTGITVEIATSLRSSQ